MYRKEFEEAKKFCENVYDNLIDEDDAFSCPECLEPLYYEDYNEPEIWEGKAPWSFCPVCSWSWYDETYGNYNEDED